MFFNQILVSVELFDLAVCEREAGSDRSDMNRADCQRADGRQFKRKFIIKELTVICNTRLDAAQVLCNQLLTNYN